MVNGDAESIVEFETGGTPVNSEIRSTLPQMTQPQVLDEFHERVPGEARDSAPRSDVPRVGLVPEAKGVDPVCHVTRIL